MHFLICLPIPFYTIYIRNIISDTFEMFHLIQIYFILLHLKSTNLLYFFFNKTG